MGCGGAIVKVRDGRTLLRRTEAFCTGPGNDGLARRVAQLEGTVLRYEALMRRAI